MTFFRSLMAAALLTCAAPAFAIDIDPANEPPVPRAAPVVKVMGESLPLPGGVLVFGGTGGTGLLAVGELVKAGEKVTVMAAPSANVDALKALNVNVVTGNVLSSDDVAKAFVSAPFRVVLSVLEGTPRDASVDYEGNRLVIDAAKDIGVPRVVLLSAIGAGDSAAAPPWYLRMFRTTSLGEKTKAENYLRASGLEYTVVRAGSSLDEASSEKAVLGTDTTKYSWIARSDLARFLVSCLKGNENLNKVLTAYDESRDHVWEVFF
jgi:uncharacterized protein YbjT (DUF2867 family)